MIRHEPIIASCYMLAALGTVFAANGQVNVTQHHNNASRNGLYIDPQFTPAGAAALTRDLAFSGSITGNVYAQPLYIEGNPNGKAMVIAVTEANNVYALDATNGAIIWSVNVGPSVALSFLNCGNINPSGITGTPVVDLPSRSLLFDAVVLNTQTDTPEHLIYSLDVDTGSVNEGWPVHVDGNAISGSTAFVSQNQGQRGALAIVDSNVYVPYGGLDGDCDTYYGWVVGVPLSNPSTVMAWATSALKGGIWSVNGVSSDGTSPFFATGNTYNASGWSGGEAIIHPQSNLVLPSGTGNYWAPVNWASLDSSDLDIGSSGALLVDVPGATPSALVAAFGKDGNAYLLNQANLGGVSAPVAKLQVAGGAIVTAPATYQTSKGTYVVYANGGYLYALRIGDSNPPTITSVWSASEGGSGSPFVTSTDGTNNVIVWGIGSESDQRLHAFDGDTGASIFTGGGANELMAGTRRWNTAIVARGRIYVANDNMVYAFSVPNTGPSPVANNDSYTFTENTTLTVSAPGVLANDTDSASYTLSAVLASGPAHGTLNLNANGGFAYTPATNFSGSDSFTYYATDGTSNSSVATVTLTGLAAGVLFSDNFARATNPGPLTPWVAESGDWTVTGGMMQGDGASAGYGSVYVTNSWSNYTVQGSVRFSTTSAYGAGLSGRLNPANGARYAAWIYPENSANGGPMLKLIKFQSWTGWSYQGNSYTPMQEATLTGVGTNWHTLQLSFQGNQIAVLYDGNEVISVADAEAGPYASGAIGLNMYADASSYTFSVENVTVTGAGAAPPKPNPVANNDSYTFTENTTLTVGAPGVLANDTDTAGYTLTAVLASNPSHGTLTLNANGSFAYTPAANFSGSDSFTYYASDGTSNSSVATVTLTGLAAGVLFSDNFARATNPGPLTPWLEQSGAWTVTGGTLQGTGTGQGYGAVYVTNSWSNYIVQGGIRFSTTSAYGGGISGRLNPATGARYAAWVYPEASPADGPLLKLIKFQSWTGWSYQGSSYMPMQQATLSSVGTNWHTLQLGFQGNQIAVSFDGDQVLNVSDAESSPYADGAIGFDMYAASTPYTFSAENLTVTSSVLAPDPVANNDSYSFTENTALTVSAPGVLANDTDSPGYTLTAVLAGNPAHGTLTLNANGGFTYTPATNFSGSDSFTYYASDGVSNSSVATVTLTGNATAVLFSDNFARATNPGPLAPWVAESGTWTVTGGMMQGVGAASSYAAVYVTNSWSNYTAQGSIRFTTTSAYGGGLTARLNPATGARYAAWVYPEESPSGGPILKLIKFQSWTGWSYQGAAYTPIQQVTLASVGTNWHTLQLSVQGNQIAVSYDGSKVVNAADAEASPYLDGGIGFDAYTGSVGYTFEVENVTVSQ